MLTDPAGEEPLTAWPTGSGARRLAGADPRDQARGRRRRAAPRGAPDRAAICAVADWRRPARAAVVVDAVAELLACFPVYRSYLPDGRAHLDHAFADAPGAADPTWMRRSTASSPCCATARHPAALRFQQTSGMVMAKGVEDCAFYRYPRLTSLNEVGGDPSVFSVDRRGFHDAMATRQAEWPHAMTALTTHDTKRSEDARARIAVLAEIPDVWERRSTSCYGSRRCPTRPSAPAVAGGPRRLADDSARAPAARVRREGDARGRRPHHVGRARRGLRGGRPRGDRRRVRRRPGARRARRPLGRSTDAGCSNALAAKLLGLTIPGVPDVYQGSELREQSLVDPDNRRPVDFDAPGPVLDGRRGPGQPKLRVVLCRAPPAPRPPRALHVVRPGAGAGEAADHVLAFDRGGAVTVVTRLPVGLAAARLGRHRARAARRGRGATC